MVHETLRDVLLDHIAIGEPPEDDLRRTLPPCSARGGAFDVEWVLLHEAERHGSMLYVRGSVMIAQFVPRHECGEWYWELSESVRVGAHRGWALIDHPREWAGGLPCAVAQDAVCSDEEQRREAAA